jgi:hypothetical protein
MSITLLNGRANCVIWDIPTTKPDPEAPCTRETFYTRPQVPRPLAKGHTCSYYAARMLSQRIGKCPSEEFAALRKAEVIISRWRKGITAGAGLDLSARAVLASQAMSDLGLTEKMMLSRFYDLSKDSDLVGQLSRLPERISSATDAQLPIMAFKLRSSPWHPDHSIESLLKILQENGPMYVGGFFGAGNYTERAHVLVQKIEGRDLRGWPAGTFRERFAHSIVVTGASTSLVRGEVKEWIYFVDPCEDPSDIYVMSYASLQDRAISGLALTGRRRPEEPYSIKGNGIRLGFGGVYGFHPPFPCSPLEGAAAIPQ